MGAILGSTIARTLGELTFSVKVWLTSVFHFIQTVEWIKPNRRESTSALTQPVIRDDRDRPTPKLCKYLVSGAPFVKRLNLSIHSQAQISAIEKHGDVQRGIA